MDSGQLLRYIIEVSEVVPAKKQEAREYLAKLEQAAQQSEQAGLWNCPNGDARAIKSTYAVCPECGTPRR